MKINLNIEAFKKKSKDHVNEVIHSIQSMKEINHDIAEAVELMSKVKDSSKQISEVIEMWSDITEETSILALNATVQAVKAGEAGRPFKVVADSIQELAENAGEAARRVGNLVAIVQTNITSANKQVDKTYRQVSSGIKLSEEANSKLNRILENSDDLADVIITMLQNEKVREQIPHEVLLKIKEITERS